MNDFPQVYEKSKLDEMYAQLNLPNETLQLLHDYFTAFSEFYQIISLHDAFNIIKRHNGDIISTEDFLAFSETVRHDDRHFYYILGADELYDDVPTAQIADMEIVHEHLVDFDLDSYYEVSESQRGKPLYIPEKEELLKYTDNFYFEHNPQTDALCDFFKNKMGENEEKADDLVGECVLCITCAIFHIDDPVDDVLNDFARMRIQFTKLQRYEFVNLLCDLVNNTRHCCNRGYTPNELADRFGISEKKTVSGIVAAENENNFAPSDIGLMAVVKFSPPENFKVGRNDPCPCGSGKKYKRCCGR